MSLKVLVLTSWFPRDQEPYKTTFVKQICDSVNKYTDVEQTVISPVPFYKDNAFESLNSNLKIFMPYFFKLPKYQGWLNDYFYLRAVLNTIKKNGIEFDIIHAHGLYPDTFIAKQLATIFNVKVVYHSHDTIINNDQKTSKLLRELDLVLAVSEFQKNKLIDCFNLNNIEVVSNVVKDYFFTKSVNHDTKKDDELRLVHVGRLHKQKGLSWLINNFTKMQEGCGEVYLDLYGTGPEKEMLVELVLEKKLEKYINFCDAVSHDEVGDVLTRYDAFISPTQYETFGISFVESLAVGLPVMISDIEPMNQMEGIYEAVYLFKLNNIQSLIEQMNKLKCDTIQKEKFKEFALKYTEKGQALQIQKIYKKLLSGE